MPETMPENTMPVIPVAVVILTSSGVMARLERIEEKIEFYLKKYMRAATIGRDLGMAYGATGLILVLAYTVAYAGYWKV